MSNIIDTIRLSGTDYTLSATSSGVSVVEMTQAQYDALPSSAKTDTSKMYVITDAEAGDLTNYYTKTETNSAITQATSGKVDTTTFNTYSGSVETALSGKQDTLVSGTNIKTINNQSLLGSGNIDVQGGGGKAVSGGTNISITTGETADTINCTLPITAGTGYHSILIGSGVQAGGNSSVAEGYVTYANGDEGAHAEGYTTYANGKSSHAEGRGTYANGSAAHAEGMYTSASGISSHAEGTSTKTTNVSEHASGRYNNSVSASTTFGDSGNTLFSVGNGTADDARHNAFEIRQNGDIYLSSGGTDIKLQDHLGGGGGSITVDTELSTTSENPVQNKVVTAALNGKGDALQWDMTSTARKNIPLRLMRGNTILNSQALNLGDYLQYGSPTSSALCITGLTPTTDFTTYTAATDTALASKQTTLTAGTGISIIDNVISATGGGGGGGTVESAITSGSTNAVESKAIWSATTYNKDVLLTFNGRDTTNYPQGCPKIKVEDITSYSMNTIIFSDDSGLVLGSISVSNWGSISVDTSSFQGVAYEISGTTVIISYPAVTTVAKLNVIEDTKYTYKAVIEGVWIADNTYMKSEVDAIQNALQNSINEKLDSTAYTPTVVDSSLNVVSTNPVQNQALYSELRIGNGGETETTLAFEGGYSTNYPNGCTKIKVDVDGSNNGSYIDFYNDLSSIGNIMINNWGSLSVDASGFQGASYEISGTTVIISYPTVTNVTRIQVNAYSSNYTYKAVTTEPPTILKNQVVANTTALGGLSLVKLTQAQYDALATKDSNTLYVIVN